jgi:hypothetical protein
MCGDDDDYSQVDEELFKRFLILASSLGVTPVANAANTPVDLTGEKSRTTYMDGLFKAGLTRAVNDASHLLNGERMDVLAGQAIVFARLSGVLAGQFPAESDMFHTVVNALMQGHKEAGPVK